MSTETSIPLLTTKLNIPPQRPHQVSRRHLIERLNQGLQLGHRLTLVSGPAGFGKTTLVAEWLSGLRADSRREDLNQVITAWLSLDEGDNDPARFLTYLVTAINRAGGKESTVGKGALSLLQSREPPPAEPILCSLINDVADNAGRTILVLDDYHLIDSPAVDEALTFLLEHLPPQFHLVVATRIDPNLPLGRLRAGGDLTELRATELRFSSSEAAAFLNEVMGLNLSAEDIAALETRTEGWVAGLQLAALALQGTISRQGRENASSLIKAFTGSHRFVLDYLVEEVLEQQPEGVQNFLLQTAILDRLTGSLCDAVTGQLNGQATLEMLEDANLFIVALDHQRHWYRYHHLFSDLLRRRLRQTQSAQIRQLHLSASKWYEQKDLWPEAIRHAFAAEDLERVADLAERAWRPMNMSYRAVTWLEWVKALPEALVRSRPALSNGCGWASLDTGDLEAADRHFRDAERWLEITENVKPQLVVSLEKAASASSQRPSRERSRNLVALDEEELRSLATSIANGRAYLAQALGDVAGTVKYARQASELLREDEFFEQGLSDILAGFAYWASGDLETAFGAVASAIAKMQKAGKLPFVISFTSYLVDIMTAQGRLREAVKVYLQLLEIAAEQGKPEAPETAVPNLGLSELYLEQGDMEAARRHLQRSEVFGEQPWFAPWYRHWIVAHARVMGVQGDLDGVLELLNGADRLYYRHPIPDVHPLKALIARTHLARGELLDARRWVGEQGLSIADDLSYLREFEHITLARVLIAQYEHEQDDTYIQDATELLGRLLKAAEEGGRVGSTIEILLLQAVAIAAQGDTHHALGPLERALMLAEPEGFFQLFLDEGPPMARLLFEMVSREIVPDYVRRLLAAFPVSGPEQAAPPQPESSEFDWIEPLSERELEVLQLIAGGLTNRHIAERLYLALNTVKAHTRNIYGKLDVHSRTHAVARARELGILADAVEDVARGPGTDS